MILPNSFYEATITLIPNSDNTTKKKKEKKITDQSLKMNIDAKIFKKQQTKFNSILKYHKPK